MGTPTFDVNDVVDVKRGAVTYRQVRVRKVVDGVYEGTYRVKARGGNPAYTNVVRFRGGEVVTFYDKIFARYGD